MAEPHALGLVRLKWSADQAVNAERERPALTLGPECEQVLTRATFSAQPLQSLPAARPAPHGARPAELRWVAHGGRGHRFEDRAGSRSRREAVVQQEEHSSKRHTEGGGTGFRSGCENVTLPIRISSCATRQAFMDFEATRDGAPDCNCRALRAAPFTRLYLFGGSSLADTRATSKM